jgi:hypothetical protein
MPIEYVVLGTLAEIWVISTASGILYWVHWRHFWVLSPASEHVILGRFPRGKSACPCRRGASVVLHAAAAARLLKRHRHRGGGRGGGRARRGGRGAAGVFLGRRGGGHGRRQRRAALRAHGRRPP